MHKTLLIETIFEHYMSKKNRYLPYLGPFLVLVTSIGLTWYLIFQRELFQDDVKKITATLSILGLGFSLFQFWFNEVKSKLERKFTLRYSAYQEIIELTEAVFETINSQITTKEPVNAYLISNQLMNQVNRLSLSININTSFQYDELDKTSESQQLQKTLEKILRRTEEYRLSIDNLNRDKQFESDPIFLTIEQYNWHNDIAEFMHEFTTNKYNFYNRLRSYM